MSYDISLQNKIFLDILMSLLKLYTAVADPEEAVGPDPWLNMFLSIYLWFTVGRLFISVGTLHSHPPPSAKMTSIDFCKVHVFRTSFLDFIKLIPHEWNRINHPVYKTKKSTRLMFVVIFTFPKSDYARSFFEIFADKHFSRYLNSL